MAPSLIVQRRLSSLMKRFKFVELEDAVMPIFPEITWSLVRSQLIKKHENFTIANAMRVIEKAMIDAKLREEDLQDRVAMLEVIDISRHNKKKIWYGYELRKPNKPANYLGKHEIERKIEEEFDSIGLDTNVKVETYNDITFVCIKEKMKKRQLKRTAQPVFFALFLGHQYFFCSKRIISHDFIKVIAIILGYNDGKRIQLMGKDLRSLMKLLWIKQQGVLHAEDLNRPSVYEPSEPVFTNMGIDYTQARQRKNYVEQCFGKDPPTLESLVINGAQSSIQHHDLASLLPTDTIHMNWEIRSNNITKFLTDLVEKRVLTLPLPHYASDFIRIGKNELTLQAG